MDQKQSNFGPEFDLMQDSVSRALAQIRLYRIAFGRASSDIYISRAETVETLDGWFSGSRITLSHDLPSELPRADLKSALLALLCLEKQLPRGGAVAIAYRDGLWRVDTDVSLSEASVIALSSPPYDAEASNIQDILFHEVLRNAAKQVEVTQTEIGATLTF